jgi:vacuolar-type H+-ATPase subunit H
MESNELISNIHSSENEFQSKMQYFMREAKENASRLRDFKTNADKKFEELKAGYEQERQDMYRNWKEETDRLIAARRRAEELENQLHVTRYL